jgi:hypothetical protein
MLPVLCDSFDNVFLSAGHSFCIADSVLSDKDGADDKEKKRAGDVACADHSPWDVVTVHD